MIVRGLETESKCESASGTAQIKFIAWHFVYSRRNISVVMEGIELSRLPLVEQCRIEIEICGVVSPTKGETMGVAVIDIVRCCGVTSRLSVGEHIQIGIFGKRT